MKRLCLIFSISLISGNLICQSLGDSVIIFIENKVELKMAIPNYGQLSPTHEIRSVLREFQQLVSDMEDQLSPASAELVRFTPGNSVTIEPGEPKYTYLISQETLRNTGYRDQVVITGENYIIFITSVDLINLVEMPLVACYDKVVNMLPESTKFSRSLYYQCIDGEMLELKNQHETNGKIDVLEIGLTAGGGLVENNWVTDLSLAVGLGLVEKGVTKFQPYISSDLLFGFDNETGDIDLNLFLSLGIHPNIVKDKSKSTFLGVDIGYLMVDNGDLFEGNTFRLGVNWSPLKGVFVGPRLYATDDFNRVFPGIRIGFGF